MKEVTILQETPGKYSMWKPICLVAVISLSLCVGNAYKILVVFPLVGRSHSILGEGVVRNLLDAGHEVTYVAIYPPKPRPGLRYIDISQMNEIIDSSKVVNVSKILNKEMIWDNKMLFQTVLNFANHTMNLKPFQDLLLDPNEKFDLVIPEWTYNELYSGLAAVFDCPFIWISSMEVHGSILQLIDDIPNPAYTAGMQSNNALPFTFFERVTELVGSISVNFIRNVQFFEKENEFFKSLFGPIMEKKGRPLPPYNKLKYGASMVLGNSHVSTGEPTRLPSSYVGIGGYHIDPKVEPLPEDLKHIIDNAKHGVIYFSLGSIVKGKDLPDIMKQEMLKMFGDLKQTVLWKFEEKLPDLPNNVHILEWAPQSSILSHPNCKLFITHGGLLSTTEIIYFGKPGIGIPVFADQFLNINRCVRKGFMKRVDLHYNFAKDLKLAIEDIISNLKYAEKAEQLSFIFHDRPVSPGKELVHWVEHVIKTNGAPHLRSPALQLPWYQKMYLDLLALILVLLLVINIAVRKIIKFLYSTKKTDLKNKSN